MSPWTSILLHVYACIVGDNRESCEPVDQYTAAYICGDCHCRQTGESGTVPETDTYLSNRTLFQKSHCGHIGVFVVACRQDQMSICGNKEQGYKQLTMISPLTTIVMFWFYILECF